jgi:hypothetical protein
VESRSILGDTSFKESKWFTMGWTLQDLIAPSKVEFYNARWERVGNREDSKNEIAAITGIDVRLFYRYSRPVYFSIAKRMSWASRGSTTRLEDMAYCLLGIFEVNMPLYMARANGHSSDSRKKS